MIMWQAPQMPNSTKRLIYCLDEERRLREFSETELESQVKKVTSLENRLAEIQDENSRLESSVAEERRLREHSETALDAQAYKVFSLERQLEAAKKAVQRKLQTMERMRKHLEGDAKKRDRESGLPFVASFQADTKKLVAERDDLKQRVDAVLSSLAGVRASFWNEFTGEGMEGKNMEDKLVMAEAARSAAGPAVAHQKAQAMKCDTDLAIALKEKENLKKKLVRVERERDAALLALAQQKAEVTKCDTDLAAVHIEKRNLKRKLSLIEEEKAQVVQESDDDLKMLKLLVRERDAALLALAEQKENLKKCDTHLAAVLIEKGNLERNLILVEDEKARMVKECDDELKTLIQSHTEELEMAITDMVEMKMTVESLREENCGLDAAQKATLRTLEESTEELEMAVTDMVGMKMTVESLREENCGLDAAQKATLRTLEEERDKHLCQLESLKEQKFRLDVAHKVIQRNLEEETEKRLCQICMESPKDTISFPCLHFHYCFSCLEKHRKRNNTCPSCRTTISGKLKLDICT